MAQQSARRDQENQGFPPCLEHALGDLDRIRELPYRPAAARRRTTGRTDGSIRLRVRQSRIHSCAEGGVHRWKADTTEITCLGCALKQLGPSPTQLRESRHPWSLGKGGNDLGDCHAFPARRAKQSPLHDFCPEARRVPGDRPPYRSGRHQVPMPTAGRQIVEGFSHGCLRQRTPQPPVMPPRRT